MRMAIKGARERNAEYGSYAGFLGEVREGDGRGNRVVAGVGVVGVAARCGEGTCDNGGEGGEESNRESSACRRGMKPGNIDVPPATKIEQAKSFRRSSGT